MARKTGETDEAKGAKVSRAETPARVPKECISRGDAKHSIAFKMLTIILLSSIKHPLLIAPPESVRWDRDKVNHLLLSTLIPSYIINVLRTSKQKAKENLPVTLLLL